MSFNKWHCNKCKIFNSMGFLCKVCNTQNPKPPMKPMHVFSQELNIAHNRLIDSCKQFFKEQKSEQGSELIKKALEKIEELELLQGNHIVEYRDNKNE